MISFKLCGTTICLHFSFFAMLCLYFQLEREGYGVSCLFTALVHETGHLIAFAVQKAAPKELHFQLGGIRLIPPDEPLSFPGELFTLAAGSMVSLFCGSFLYYKDSQTALPHLLTGLFSLLPLPGLDGGEIVSLFQSRFFPEKEYFFRITGQLLAICTVLLLIVSGLLFGSPLSLLPAMMILFAALLNK